METGLPIDHAFGYKSLSQIARVLTEQWLLDNMYCPACDSDHLCTMPTGTRVYDFRCETCDELYQLKSRSSPFRRRVVDAAYEPMVNAIKKNQAPTFFFVHYLRDVWKVCNFFMIPAHFVSLTAIEERKPLSPTAERKGWVGCNILLDRLPPDGRIPVIEEGVIRSASDVRNDWRRFSFLKESSWSSRGWTSDILAYLRRLGKKEFSLKDVYAFEKELAELHPKNKHIKPKIRQQLQILRDRGILRFLEKGRYRMVR